MKLAEFEHQYQVNKLGKPIDRTEWMMSPQTINAYYNPLMNEIVFPAAILQPPFFNMKADDAVNYGGIGAVIGHELSHGFDDSGSRFDGDGNLRDWWTPKDREEFDRRANLLVAQYDSYKPFSDMNVQGRFTLGENIGDLGGLAVAYHAYRLSLEGKEAPKIDGLTGINGFLWGGHKFGEESTASLNCGSDCRPIPTRLANIGSSESSPTWTLSTRPLVSSLASRCTLHRKTECGYGKAIRRL